MTAVIGVSVTASASAYSAAQMAAQGVAGSGGAAPHDSAVAQVSPSDTAGSDPRAADLGIQVPPPFYTFILTSTSTSTPSPNTASAGASAFFGVTATTPGQQAAKEANAGSSGGTGVSGASGSRSLPGAVQGNGGSGQGQAIQDLVIPKAHIIPEAPWDNA